MSTIKQMKNAILVLRMHLVELEKVHELCTGFAEQYIETLRLKLNSDNILRIDDGETGADFEGNDDDLLTVDPLTDVNNNEVKFGGNQQILTDDDESAPTGSSRLSKETRKLNVAKRQHQLNTPSSLSSSSTSSRLLLVPVKREHSVGEDTIMKKHATNANGYTVAGLGYDNSSHSNASPDSTESDTIVHTKKVTEASTSKQRPATKQDNEDSDANVYDEVDGNYGSLYDDCDEDDNNDENDEDGHDEDDEDDGGGDEDDMSSSNGKTAPYTRRGHITGGHGHVNMPSGKQDMDFLRKSKRGILPKNATNVMKRWLFQHIVVSSLHIIDLF